MKRRISLTHKVTMVFVLFAALLLAIVGSLAYFSGHSALQDANIADLLSKAKEKEAALDTWVKERQKDVVSLAAMPHFVDDLAQLATIRTGATAARAAHDHLARELRLFTGQNLSSLFVMAPQTGRILVSTNPLEEGRFKEDTPYFINGKSGPYVHGPYNSLDIGGPAITIAAPVRSQNGRLLGVLAGRLKLDDMSAVINPKTGLYQTDDSYLVNRSSFFVTQPRFISDPVVLSRGIHTEAVKRGMRGESGYLLTRDYRDVPTITVYRWLPMHRLCLVVERDQQEAFAPAQAFGKVIILITVLALLIALIVAIRLARTITRPVLALQAGAARFGRGETDVRLNEKAGDELGDLAREFNRMAAAISKREAALRESESRYFAFFDKAPLGYQSLDEEGNFIEVNQVWLETLGYGREEVIGKWFGEFLAPEFVDAFRERFLIFKAIGTIHSEFQMLHKNGRRRFIAFDGRIGRKEDGSFKQTHCILTDITGRKQAEEALRNAAREWSISFDAMSDGVSIHDVDHTILRVNLTLCRMLEKRKEEIIGKKCYNIFHGMNNPIAGCPIELTRQTLRDEHADFFETTLNKWLSVSSSPVFDDSGQLIRFVHIVRDVTERKRIEEERRILEERLQRAERMEALGLLAGGVAHDLNNVLGVLFVYTELLLEKVPEGSPLRNYVENILSSGEKGAAIIQDLLTLARRGVMVQEVVNVNRVVTGFFKTPVFERIEAQHPRVTFRKELSGELLNINGSPIHLEKTVMNLLSNAAEAISGSGEITIRTENRYLDRPVHGYDTVKEGEYVVLTVADTGGGISAADMGKIFEPFYTKKVMGRSGTGLGLAIVWGTVKDHDGYINVQSEAGKGTIFTLYFPVTREEVAEKKGKLPVEQYMGRGESILVVDDTAEQRDIATRILTRLGYEVHTVASGEEAVEYLKTQKTDLLILDMIMDPGIDGLETYKRVLETNPKQRAIIVSGFSETERVKKAQDLGAGAYVRKPYLMEKIGVAVRDELRKVQLSPGLLRR